ncbi:hypothetical protein ColKHC_11022 [Colletotrichum higginsianum]|nr:hypothetical protein ColKHC_11022 [Colletotrichum higginsianum]
MPTPLHASQKPRTTSILSFSTSSRLPGLHRPAAPPSTTPFSPSPQTNFASHTGQRYGGCLPSSPSPPVPCMTQAKYTQWPIPRQWPTSCAAVRATRPNHRPRRSSASCLRRRPHVLPLHPVKPVQRGPVPEARHDADPAPAEGPAAAEVVVVVLVEVLRDNQARGRFSCIRARPSGAGRARMPTTDPSPVARPTIMRCGFAPAVGTSPPLPSQRTKVSGAGSGFAGNGW